MADDEKDQLQRNMLSVFLRHPIGLKVIQGWFDDAAKGRIGPGDLLDQKYPAHFEVFKKRCAHISAMLASLPTLNRDKVLDAVVDKLAMPGDRIRFSLMPKDNLLISLGTYLRTDDAARHIGTRHQPSFAMLQRFSMATGIAPNANRIEAIAIGVHTSPINPVIITAHAERAARTRYGHAVLLHDTPVMKRFPLLRRKMLALDLMTRPKLLTLAHEMGFRGGAAIKQMNHFLDSHVISKAPKSLNQLTLFAKKMAIHLNTPPEKLYAGAYPPSIGDILKSDRSMKLAHMPVFAKPSMLPVLRAWHDRGVFTRHALIAELLKSKSMAETYIYTQMRDFEKGDVIIRGPRGYGKPIILARLVASLVGFDPATVYADFPVRDGMLDRVKVKNMLISPRGNDRKSSAPQPC